VFASLAVAVELAIRSAAAQPSFTDPTLVCQIAADQAERAWLLPKGLLAAIGLVESGRRAPAGPFPVIWPWTINAEGRGFYLPSKAAAVGLVRSLQLRGVRIIDVGCFQVDLFYHPYAFASLEEAFDPDANARAAARILSLGRLSSTGWDGAIAAYHSAVPLAGWVYLQKVRAVWPWAKAHPPWGQDAAATYAVLLSPQARLVRIVTPFDLVAESVAERPRVTAFLGSARMDRAADAVLWLHPPPANLPRVLTPSAPGIPPSRY
jgi:hypothetical protein